MKNCCEKIEGDKGEIGESKGLIKGLVFGILPHSFCLAFVVFSAIGAISATTIFKRLLLLPYFFEVLIGLSLLFATISAVIYLRRKKQLSIRGIGGNWGYLGILFGTTIFVNLFFFLVIFPMAGNLGIGRVRNMGVLGEVRDIRELRELTIKVRIPCAGHAPLITEELKKIEGVEEVKFANPNQFKVDFDPRKTSVGHILSNEIFKSFPAEIKIEG